MQCVLGVSPKPQRDLTLADASSGHQHLQFRQLDWFSALHADDIPFVRDMMAEADADLILGADIVRPRFRRPIADHKLIFQH
jgi:hypothetical protein